METKALVIGGAIIGLVVLAILWQARKDVIALGGAAVDAAQAVNPLNPNNVIAGGVNDVGAAVTGDSNFSLGAWLYEATHSMVPG